MRRTASEILRGLENRIARLEKTPSTYTQGTWTDDEWSVKVKGGMKLPLKTEKDIEKLHSDLLDVWAFDYDIKEAERVVETITRPITRLLRALDYPKNNCLLRFYGMTLEKESGSDNLTLKVRGLKVGGRGSAWTSGFPNPDDSYVRGKPGSSVYVQMEKTNVDQRYMDLFKGLKLELVYNPMTGILTSNTPFILKASLARGIPKYINEYKKAKKIADQQIPRKIKEWANNYLDTYNFDEHIDSLVDDYIDKYVEIPYGEEEGWYDYGGRQSFAESLRSDSKLVAQKVRYLDDYDRPIFYFLCKIDDKGCLVRWDFTKNDYPLYPVKPLWGDLKELKSRHYDR